MVPHKAQAADRPGLSSLVAAGPSSRIGARLPGSIPVKVPTLISPAIATEAAAAATSGLINVDPD
jgi:hypothetical protein